MADRLAGARERLHSPRERLAWALGTFHVAVLTVVALLAIHSTGSLGDLLRGLDTGTGTALYLVVWLAGWLATRAALGRSASSRNPLGSDRVSTVLVRGVAGGAAAGVAVALVGLLALTIPAVLDRGASVSSVVLVTAIGGGVALVVGMVVGAVLALLDVVLVGLADRLAPGQDPG